MPAPTVLQLNVLDARPAEDGPFTYVRAFRDSDPPIYLFAVCEADGPYAAEACRMAIDAAVHEFTGGKESITGRLQHALNVAHQELLAENRRSLPAHQSMARIACAYLRENELYLAYCGPVAAWVLGENPRCLITQTNDGPEYPLGAGRPEIWVRRHRLQPGQTILLASSPCGLEPASLNGAGPPKDAAAGIADIYRRAYTRRALGALAIDPRVAEEAGDREEPAPPLRQERPEPPREPAPARAPHIQKPRPYSYGATVQAPAARPVAPPSHAPWEGPHLNISVDLRTPVLRTRRSLMRIPPRVLFGLAGLVVLTMAMAGFMVAAQDRQNSERAQAATLVQEAAEAVEQAGSASSGDEQRRQLNLAQEKLDQAGPTGAALPQAAELAGRIRDGLSQLDAVTPLQDVRGLMDGTIAPPGSVLFRQLLVLEGGVYLLDRRADRVVQLTLGENGAGTGLASLYQGRAANRSRLVTLLWLPKGGAWPRDSMLVFDENRSLFELRTGAEPQPLALRGASEWESFQTARGYDGSLYVLDPKGSQVWRYVPTETGFDTERRPVLPSVDLRDAVDFAVDGDVYVLLRSGKVLKFGNGRPQPFSQDGLDATISSPSAIFTSPSARSVYVADTGKRRVVVFDKESGRFLRQYPTGDIPTVNSIWADEQKGILYLGTDAQVYSAKMSS